MRRPHPGLHHLIVATHLLFALSVFNRPHLYLLLPSFARFDDIAPWLTWGWTALGIAGLLAASRPGTVLGQFAHFISSAYFFLVAGAITIGVGTTPTVTTFTALGVASLVLFAADFRQWVPQVGVMQRLAERPPGWVRRRYGRD